MDLVQLFRRFVFLQVMLGIVAFCVAEGNAGMLVIAGGLGAMSWYIAEGPAGRPLPQWAIHVGALAVLAWLALEVRRTYQHFDASGINVGLIVAMGHFTIWLQLLQLYGRKGNREYGLVLVLGLVQMVAASVLSFSLVYAMLLAIYCIIGLMTALLFHLKMVSDRVLVRQRAMAEDPMSVERARPVMGRGFRWQWRTMTWSLGLTIIAVAVAVFIFTPRSGDPLQSALGRHMVIREVGFSDQVALAGGPILTGNRDVVLKLTVTRDGIPMQDSAMGMLLRGAVLDDYDQTTHTWRRSSFLDYTEQNIALGDQGTNLTPDDHTGSFLEANILLRHVPQNMLFTPYPPLHIQSAQLRRMIFNTYDQRLAIGSRSTGGPMQYRVRYPTGMVVRDTMPDYVTHLQAFPHGRFPRNVSRELLTEQLEQMGRGWEVQPERFARLAMRILHDAGLERDSQAMDDPNDERIAMALERYFHRSPDFVYTLDIPEAGRGEDPIAAFLFGHKSGHCELYASSLAALARSIGMRARIVTGFRVSEYNSIGDYYVVRQSNAHAWTEIYCHGRGWLVFDATPPLTLAREHQRAQSVFSFFNDLYDHMEFTWISSFIGYDHRKRERLFGSIQDSLAAAVASEHTALGKAIAAARQTQNWKWDRLTVFIVISIILFALASLASLVHALLRRRRVAALKLKELPRNARGQMARQLRFYLQMIDLLRRHGLTRPQWQSPFDFAHLLVQQDQQRFAPVLDLTQIFYEMRFGHRPLTDQRAQRIRDSLRQLQSTLAATE